MANKLYSAYRGAGKASSSYKASLYDIENLGIEREASQSMYQFETAQRDKTLALVQEGIGMASDLYGGYKSKKDATEARGKVQEGMAEKAYGESESEKLKLDKTYKSVDWDKLGTESKSSELAKFEPEQVKQGFFDKIFGAEKSYTFGKGEGKNEFTSGQISATALSSGEDKLSELLGISSSSSSKGDLKEIQDKIMESTKVTSKEKSEDIDLGPKDEDSNKLSEFGQLFKDARGRGDKDFTFKDKLYNTNLKKYAKGGKFTTNGPEMILVGDNPGGKEKVTVKPIKSKKKEKSEGQESLADGLGSNLKQLVSKKGTKPGSNKWMSNYIQSQKMDNESLRPLKGKLSKHNKKLFSMAEESGYFGEFFRGGWER
tara:strand:+ start:301 stop:1419 length:1119 start_codon:yes stop_codon:yes gene_type:complete